MAQDRKVFVGGVPQDLTQDDLYAAFSVYATVKKAWLQKCRANEDSSCPPQSHRGFGFVIFHDSRAIDELLGGSTSRFVVLRNGAKVEVKRAMSSIKISQSKDEGLPAQQIARPGKPAAQTSGQTWRTDPSQIHWPMPALHQRMSHLESSWMPDTDSNQTGEPTSQLLGQMSPWYWSPHANVGALMTDALRQQYAAPFDMMPQHVPIVDAWHRRGLLPTDPGGSERHDQGHASQVLGNIMHDYDEYARHQQSWPENAHGNLHDPPTDGLPLATGSFAAGWPLDPIGTGADVQRREEFQASSANRKKVLAVASPARPHSLAPAKPLAPPGLDVESDPAVPREGHERDANVRRYLI